MKLIINGKENRLGCEKVSDLLNKLGLNKNTVAVELNKNIVHRQNFDDTNLKDNDKLEEDIEYFKDPRNLEKEARARFNYRAPNEKMIMIVPPQTRD